MLYSLLDSNIILLLQANMANMATHLNLPLQKLLTVFELFDYYYKYKLLSGGSSA